jgi:hypothetical protein
MALLSKKDVEAALTRMGELALANNESLEFLLLGGGLMVLHFETRQATRDLDVVILSPPEAAPVRELARSVAAERGWPDDWINDAAKGFVVGLSLGPVVFSAPGIQVRRPGIAQLLAMKLCAWRDDVDIADARRLLTELSGDYDSVWKEIEPHLQPGRELKAKLAFEDLWDETYDKH